MKKKALAIQQFSPVFSPVLEVVRITKADVRQSNRVFRLNSMGIVPWGILSVVGLLANAASGMCKGDEDLETSTKRFLESCKRLDDVRAWLKAKK